MLRAGFALRCTAAATTRIDKPLVLLSEDDFWLPFIGALDQTIAQEFAGDSISNLYRHESSLDAAFAALGLN